MPNYMPYEQTTVQTSKTQEDIKKLLRKFHVEGVQFEEMWTSPEGEDLYEAQIRFRYQGRVIRFSVKSEKAYKYLRSKKRGKDEDFWREQSMRMAFRFLLDFLKAMLLAVDYGIVDFDDVFMPHYEFQLADGTHQTIIERLRPHLAKELEMRKILSLPAPKTK